jgi:hypothetical protein
MGVLCSVGDISPIGAFLAMRLQWLLHDAFEALPTKAAFATGFSVSQVKDQWSTTSLDATGDARRDLALLCNTLTDDPAHPDWCLPISLLVPRTHTSEGWSDACYEGLGKYSVQWNTTWRITRPEMAAARFLTKALNVGECEPHPGCNGLHINPLELIGVIINVVLALTWATTVPAPVGGHVFRIWADNKSTLSWLKNTLRDTNPIVRCLVRFLMAILVASGIPCILQDEHIPGENNVGADWLSHPTLAPTWAFVIGACSKVKLFRRCQLLHGLLSALASTISSGLIETNVEK